MKFRYAIYFFLFPCLVEVFMACGTCSSGPSGGYRFKEIEVSHIINSDGKYAIATSESVSSSTYGLLVYLAIDHDNIAMGTSRPFSFLTSAFACDPGPEMYPLDRFTEFKITSLQDFDESHPAGSDLSTYFEVKGIESVTTLDEYVSYFGSAKSNDINVFHLLLKTPPAEHGTFQFKLEATLKDGGKLETTATAISLVE